MASPHLPFGDFTLAEACYNCGRRRTLSLSFRGGFCVRCSSLLSKHIRFGRRLGGKHVGYAVVPYAGTQTPHFRSEAFRSGPSMAGGRVSVERRNPSGVPKSSPLRGKPKWSRSGITTLLWQVGQGTLAARGCSSSGYSLNLLPACAPIVIPEPPKGDGTRCWIGCVWRE